MSSALRAVSPTQNSHDFIAIQDEIRRGRQHESTIQLLDAAINGELRALVKTPGRLEALHQQLRYEREQRNVVMTRALRMTAAAYQIPAPSGASSHPTNKGESVSFLPVFDPELLKNYLAHTRGGPVRPRPYDRNNDGDIDARTYFNGVSVFRNIPDDPRAVALLVIHEAKHAEQFAGQSRLDYAEYRARRASLDAFFQVGFTGADASLRARYEEDARKAKAQADYEKTFLGRSELFFHGAAVTLGLAERKEFGLTQGHLDYIKDQAAGIHRSVQAADAARRATTEYPDQPALIAPARAAEQPSLVAPRAAERPAPSYPAPLAAPPGHAYLENTRLLVQNACRRDWDAVSSLLPSLASTTGSELRMLASRLQTDCERRLLERLHTMRAGGEAITLDRIRTEIAPPQSSVADFPAERERRRPCVQRGVWFPECY